MLASPHGKRPHQQLTDSRLTENGSHSKKGQDSIDGPSKAKRNRISSSSSSSSESNCDSNSTGSSSSSSDGSDKEEGETQLTYQDWRDFVIKSYLNGATPFKSINNQVANKKPVVSTNSPGCQLTGDRNSPASLPNHHYHHHQKSDQVKQPNQRMVALTSTPKPQTVNNENAAPPVNKAFVKSPEITRTISSKPVDPSPPIIKAVSARAGSISITVGNRTNGCSKTPEKPDKPGISLLSPSSEKNTGAVNNPFFRPSMAVNKPQPPSQPPARKISTAGETCGIADKNKVKGNVIVKEVKNNGNTQTRKTTHSESPSKESIVKKDSQVTVKDGGRKVEKEALIIHNQAWTASDTQNSSKQSQQHGSRDESANKSGCTCQSKMSHEKFMQLNSNAKLNHVKSQLDGPSQKYLDKLISTFCMHQKEISKLKREKNDLIHALKKVKKIFKSEPIEELMKSVDHKNKSESK